MICYKKVCKYSIMKVIQNEQLMDVIESNNHNHDEQFRSCDCIIYFYIARAQKSYIEVESWVWLNQHHHNNQVRPCWLQS